MSMPFAKTDALPTAAVEELGRPGGPRIRRIRAGNAGPFTFMGTNSYVLGEGTVTLIDPGPEDDAHLAALLAALAGERVERILVTHTHRDHTGGLPALQAATGATTLGFGPHQTPPGPGAEGADHDFQPQHRLADGAMVAGENWGLTALHTPGHCANHLCFALEDHGILFGGDHAMSCSTSVVIPPDGDMADYMAALARVAARDWALLLPGHGAPLAEPGALLKGLLAHRREREQLVLGALGQHGPAPLEVLVPAVYGQIDPRLVRAAGHSLLAHLRKLAAEGAAAEQDGRWHGR